MVGCRYGIRVLRDSGCVAGVSWSLAVLQDGLGVLACSLLLLVCRYVGAFIRAGRCHPLVTCRCGYSAYIRAGRCRFISYSYRRRDRRRVLRDGVARCGSRGAVGERRGGGGEKGKKQDD
ncbi:MAG: hypothetical protein ACPLTR_10430 [Thermacetogeniaceae bacterium]